MDNYTYLNPARTCMAIIMIEHGIQHGHMAKVSTARQHLAVMHGHARSCMVMLARATEKVLCPPL